MQSKISICEDRFTFHDVQIALQKNQITIHEDQITIHEEQIKIHEDQIKIIYVNAMNSDTDTDTKGVLGNTIASVSLNQY